MPRPVEERRRYMPGLDGLRAIAVLAVIAYHLNFQWAEGGLLGVGVFFTLSGYLITDILLNQVNRGGIRLKSFWLARARRLLPALFVVLIVVLAWVTLIGPHQPGSFRMEAVSSAAYFNNWWLILHNSSYFERFQLSPLDHIWSLSIEEQFYIVWPFLLMLGTRFVREPEANAGGVRLRLAGVTLLAALGSLILMAILYHPSIDPSRVYYGTDTRAFELLAGAALAMVWPSRRLRTDIAPRARNLVDGGGVLGLAVIAVMFWRVGEFSPFLYRGGFAVLSIATVLAVAALTHPAARIGNVVGCRPMRWIGERSYGIYLWHMPIIVLTTPEGAHSVELLRAALQVAATFGVAELSWRFVENPIRHGALDRLYRQVRSGAIRRRHVTRVGWALAAVCAAVIATALAGLAGVGTDNSRAVGSTKVQKTVTDDGRRRPAGDDLQRGRPHRRLDLGGPGRPRIQPAEQVDRRPVRAGRGDDRSPRRLRRPLDLRELRRRTQRPGSGGSVEERRLQRLLGDRDGDQRGGERRRRLIVHLRRQDREHDGDDRRRTGPLGQHQVAGDDRALRRVEHARLGHGAAQSLRPLPLHAGLRLGLGRPRRLVHPRRHPLHLARLRKTRAN